jgi:hypothetical protein
MLLLEKIKMDKFTGENKVERCCKCSGYRNFKVYKSGMSEKGVFTPAGVRCKHNWVSEEDYAKGVGTYKPSKNKIELWNKLVEEVFSHKNAGYSIFTYELIKRRVLGTNKKEYKTRILSSNNGTGEEVFNSDKAFGIKDVE